MTLIINGTDLSNYIMQKVGIQETPVYIDGANAGMSKSGYAIRDRVRTRYTASFRLKPIPQSVMDDIIAICERNESTVIYTSARNPNTVSMTAQVSLSGWTFAVMSNGERIYSDCIITIEGN